MKATSETKPASKMDATDEARHMLCSQIAQIVRAGSFRLRVRIHEGSGEAWFYERHDNTWHKQELTLRNGPLVQALSEQLALLASKPHGDHVQVTQHDAADWKETDLQFQRECLQGHIDERLDTYVLGLLFRDPHDSKHDVRRHMASGAQRSSRRS